MRNIPGDNAFMFYCILQPKFADVNVRFRYGQWDQENGFKSF